MFNLYIVLVLCFCETRSQIFNLGKCPDVTVQENFALSKYVGKWYEASKYFAIFELLGKCIETDYSLNDNGTVRVQNSEIIELIGKRTKIVGNARPSGSDKEAKFIVNFSVFGFHIDAPYWVLESDYKSYSVVWSCTNLPFINTRFAWILTRDRNPSPAIIAKAKAVLEKNKLTRKYLRHTNQSNCPANKK